MSQTQIRVLFGTLIALHLAMALLLNPFGLSANSGPWQTRVILTGIGALIAQPALLSLWAALGPQAFLRRWAQALAVLACLTLADEFASVQNASRASDSAELIQPVMWIVAFLVCQFPLWLLRHKFRWRIQQPVGLAHRSGDGANQFSMRGLLAAMAAVAAYLAALRAIHPVAAPTEWTFALLRFAAMGVTMSLPGILVIFVCWLLLMQGPRNRWRWSIAVFGLMVVALVAAAVAQFGSPGEVGELVFVLLGTLLCTAGSVMVVRLCGYRLLRTAAGGETQEKAGFEALPATIIRRRFAATVIVMILLLAGLSGTVPRRLSLWREMAERRDWSASGLLASFVDGQVVQLQAIDGVTTHIDEAAIDRISACGYLQRLDLCGSTVNDAMLERLAALPHLTRLSLFGARLSDDGLRHLGKHRNLSDLDLRMTDVTDEGLIALAELRTLVRLDLGHTRVTMEGLAWLDERRPSLGASAITNDVTMRQMAQFFRPRLTRLSQATAPAPTAVRVRAIGPDVTDAGVVALRGMTSIIELDLTDACVTEAAVNDLATLTGLKHLVLRGTKITESRVDALRQKLPDCEIVW